VVSAPVDGGAFAAAAGAALRRGHVVVADPGEVERARLLAPLAVPPAAGALRSRAVGRTDGVLSEVLRLVPAGTVVLVVAPTPGPHPVPLVMAGPGLGHGRIELAGRGPRRQLTLADVTTTVMRLAGARVPPGATGRPLGVARGEPGSGGAAMLAGLGRSAHLAGGGAGVDAAAAPVIAALLGLLGLAGAVWLVRERGWPEAPAPGGGRASPAAGSRWLAAGAVLAASLPALALAQAAIAQAASGTRVGPLGGAAGGAAFVGVVLLGSVAVVARRAAAADPRRALRAAAWALLAGGSLTLALAPQAGRWAVVAPPSPLLGGWAGAGPAAAAAVLGGALLACATAEGALGRAVPVAVGAGVLAVPALGDDPVAAGIAVRAGAVARAWHLAPGPRRLGALVAALAAAVLAAAPALARTGVAATLARGLGADVFGWRSPWLPTALLALGAAAAIATVVVPGAPGVAPGGGESGDGRSSVDPTSIRPGAETAPTTAGPEGVGAAGRRGDRAAGWGLLLAGLLAVGLHPDGMPTAALLFSQLAGLAVMVAVRAGEPEPLLFMADPSQSPPRRTPVSA
jgi:hypothetical protein